MCLTSFWQEDFGTLFFRKTLKGFMDVILFWFRWYRSTRLDPSSQFLHSKSTCAPGVVVALMAICTVGYLSYRKDRVPHWKENLLLPWLPSSSKTPLGLIDPDVNTSYLHNIFLYKELPKLRSWSHHQRRTRRSTAAAAPGPRTRARRTAAARPGRFGSFGRAVLLGRSRNLWKIWDFLWFVAVFWLDFSSIWDCSLVDGSMNLNNRSCTGKSSPINRSSFCYRSFGFDICKPQRQTTSLVGCESWNSRRIFRTCWSFTTHYFVQNKCYSVWFWFSASPQSGETSGTADSGPEQIDVEVGNHEMGALGIQIACM